MAFTQFNQPITGTVPGVQTNVNGVLQEATGTPLSIQGSVQPASSKDLLSLPVLPTGMLLTTMRPALQNFRQGLWLGYNTAKLTRKQQPISLGRPTKATCKNQSVTLKPQLTSQSQSRKRVAAIP